EGRSTSPTGQLGRVPRAGVRLLHIEPRSRCPDHDGPGPGARTRRLRALAARRRQRRCAVPNESCAGWAAARVLRIHQLPGRVPDDDVGSAGRREQPDGGSTGASPVRHGDDRSVSRQRRAPHPVRAQLRGRRARAAHRGRDRAARRSGRVRRRLRGEGRRHGSARSAPHRLGLRRGRPRPSAPAMALRDDQRGHGERSSCSPDRGRRAGV
ncbi:MAG: Cytochrome oxidase biogenesis protein Sco1/SenC/PrrC, thiol-disulfide reductase involved in Cu(I) insertion into CoxII Cu(A) center, partial [uncultured Acidimicrobiales bacterium]